MKELVVKVKGPIKIPCHVGKGGRTISDDNIRDFWRSYKKYEDRRGCYVFGIRAGKGCTPGYVGIRTLPGARSSPPGCAARFCASGSPRQSEAPPPGTAGAASEIPPASAQMTPAAPAPPPSASRPRPAAPGTRERRARLAPPGSDISSWCKTLPKLAFFDPISGFNRPTDGSFIYCAEPRFHPFEYVIAGRIFAAEFPEASQGWKRGPSGPRKACLVVRLQPRASSLGGRSFSSDIGSEEKTGL